MSATDQSAVPALDGPAPLAGLAVYTLFRGPARQLLEWCSFHLAAGADAVYVVLDCPPADLVASLPTHPRVRWEVADQATWDAFYPRQSQNVERKQVDAFRWTARRALADGHRHLAFVDADELVWLGTPFADLATNHPDASALTLQVSEMWYPAAGASAADGPFAATLALSPTRRHRLQLNRAFGWRAQFLRRGLLGHDAGKTVYRLPLTEGRISVHRPVDGVLAERAGVLPREHGRLLHFDCGDLSTWNAKWGARLAGSTTATGLASQRLAQQQLFAHELRRPHTEQARFFDGFYRIDDEAQTSLASLGLLERVDVRELVAGPLRAPEGEGATADEPALIQLPPIRDRVDFQFAMVCDQRFVRPTFATMAAVLAKMGDLGSVRFVVLGDGLDRADAKRLRSLEHTAYDVEVLVHDITADLDRDVGTEDAKRATFGRIYLIDYLPEQRTVYLDGDVLPTREFSELFDWDLQGACLAGVPDSAALRLVANPASVPIQQRNRLMGITHGEPLDYLNGGVLIFDLDNPDFRDLALRARSLVVLQGRALKQRDQDAMNLAFAGRKCRLPSTYNYMTQFYVSDRCVDGDLPRLKYDAADAVLVHFSGKIKPWDAPDDEFYNGLYRRLVLETEERLDISCEFYFSRPGPAGGRHWDAERWTETLEPEPPAGPAPQPELEVVGFCDDGVDLRLSAPLLDLARARGLQLVLATDGDRLATADLTSIGPPRADLAERVGPGTRKLPLDLVGALTGTGGSAEDVEVLLVDPEAAPDAFARPAGVVGLVAAGEAASPDLLARLGAAGRLEKVSDGWLVGWYDARARGAGDPVSLYIGDQLVARRPPDLARPDLAGVDGEEGRLLGFRFRAAHLVGLGYGREGDRISVRVAGGVPLPGSGLTLSQVTEELEHDPATGEWRAVPRPAPKDRSARVARVRARVRRAVRR